MVFHVTATNAFLLELYVQHHKCCYSFHLFNIPFNVIIQKYSLEVPYGHNHCTFVHVRQEIDLAQTHKWAYQNPIYLGEAHAYLLLELVQVAKFIGECIFVVGKHVTWSDWSD